MAYVKYMVINLSEYRFWHGSNNNDRCIGCRCLLLSCTQLMMTYSAQYSNINVCLKTFYFA